MANLLQGPGSESHPLLALTSPPSLSFPACVMVTGPAQAGGLCKLWSAVPGQREEPPWEGTGAWCWPDDDSWPRWLLPPPCLPQARPLPRQASGAKWPADKTPSGRITSACPSEPVPSPCLPQAQGRRGSGMSGVLRSWLAKPAKPAAASPAPAGPALSRLLEMAAFWPRLPRGRRDFPETATSSPRS